MSVPRRRWSVGPVGIGACAAVPAPCCLRGHRGIGGDIVNNYYSNRRSSCIAEVIRRRSHLTGKKMSQGMHQITCIDNLQQNGILML